MVDACWSQKDISRLEQLDPEPPQIRREHIEWTFEFSGMNRRHFAFAMALTTMLFSVMAVEPASAQRSIKGGGGGGISGGGGKGIKFEGGGGRGGSVGGGGGVKSNRGGQVKVKPGSSGSVKVKGGGGRGGKRSW